MSACSQGQSDSISSPEVKTSAGILNFFRSSSFTFHTQGLYGITVPQMASLSLNMQISFTSHEFQLYYFQHNHVSKEEAFSFDLPSLLVSTSHNPKRTSWQSPRASSRETVYKNECELFVSFLFKH